jgi:hypothetical protein
MQAGDERGRVEKEKRRPRSRIQGVRKNISACSTTESLYRQANYLWESILGLDLCVAYGIWEFRMTVRDEMMGSLLKARPSLSG